VNLAQHGARTLADTQAISALFGRPAAAVRSYCTRTREGYDVHQAELALDGKPDPITMTAREAEQYLGIPRGTVRSWASRRLIRSKDHTPDRGLPKYDVQELLQLRERGEPA
jgi:hypothetical protein